MFLSFLTGKTYFFKGTGYWQFDDMKMRVAHDRQKKSAIKWMGCEPSHERLDEESGERRQHWRNPKRDEEVTDLDDDEFESNGDIDLPISTSNASILNLFNVKKFLIVILIVLLNSMNREMT